MGFPVHQQVFDTVVKHLAAQGQQSAREPKNSCEYRMDYLTEIGLVYGDVVLKCAIGCLNNLYGASQLPVFTKLLHDLDQEACHPVSILYNLQIAHDAPYNWRSLASMHNALQAIARIYRLDDAVIDQQDWSKFEANAKRINSIK